MCDCYQIGGRFIAEDPDCPEHGVGAVERREENEMIQEELSSWRARFPGHEYDRQEGNIRIRQETL